MSKKSKDHSTVGESKGSPDPRNVSNSGWKESKSKPRYKSFPGPSKTSEPLRISMTRDAYAELTAHAKESLNAEICGVLAGELCEDDDGLWVSVHAPVRGAAAKKGSTHVTFTQETWTQIHEQMERDHPGKQIVGWYHSHPGFGVEFSEMDLFVQRNFFSGPGQIAYLTDPLGGEEAILVNSDSQNVPVNRFWVDGRERRCKMAPGGRAEQGTAASPIPASVSDSLKAMDERISQLMQMVDAQSASLYRFLMSVGVIVALGICLFLAYYIYSSWTSESRPPEVQAFVPVPVQIGDKSVLLGVGIVKWDVPKSLNSAFLQLEREKRAAEESTAATQPAGAASTQPAAQSTK